MLIIMFYDFSQKYVSRTQPFENHEINQKLHEAFDTISQHSEMAGCVIYERVRNAWLPYHPFNGHYRYDRRRMRVGM